MVVTSATTPTWAPQDLDAVIQVLLAGAIAPVDGSNSWYTLPRCAEGALAALRLALPRPSSA